MLLLLICKPEREMNTPPHIYRLSNQQREPGKMSRPGKPIKNKTQLPVYIAFTFYPGGGLNSR
jgi:hypothetical protein